jgi:hypothetical protein
MIAMSKGILADHLLPRRNTGRKSAKNEIAARTLFDHQLASRRKAMSGDSSWNFPVLIDPVPFTLL